MSYNSTSQTSKQFTLSLALHDHLSPKDQLARHNRQLRNGNKLPVPPEVLATALQTLNGLQLLAMPGVLVARPRY